MQREFDKIDARLADERGVIVGHAPIRVALVYPSPYRIAMSSLGFQAIYRILNEIPEVSCERAMLPDDTAIYHESRTPLFTYESQYPVSEADVVAFSISYETELLGLLECLDLMGVPARAADRDPRFHAPIIVGGPLTFSNPLPAAPFADVIVMGEGEELVEMLVRWWADSETMEGFLRDASMLPGVYVPSIHGETLRTVAQVDDELLPAHAPIITPNTELSNMHLVENARGCHRGCSFCVMRRTTNGGMRAVAPERVLETIPDYAPKVGLVGAATTDHPRLMEIVEPIVESGRQLALSSLRADRLTDPFVGALARSGARTLTVASDGSSQRMRDLAQKHIKEEHLRRAAELVRAHEMRLLKLYVVIGYPDETMEDIEEMCAFVTELSSICNVALGMSPLVAKKNTPLDGAPFPDRRELKEKIKRVHTELGRVADIRSTSVRWAWIEYQLAQGGWSMASAAEAAYRRGGSYGAWRDAFEEFPLSEPAELRRPPDDRLREGAKLGPDDRERGDGARRQSA